VQDLLVQQFYDHYNNPEACLDKGGKALDPSSLLLDIMKGGAKILFVREKKIEALEDSVYLFWKDDPEREETVEFGEEETIQDLLEDEDYNPDDKFSIFLESNDEPLQPDLPLSKIRGRKLYFAANSIIRFFTYI